MNHCKMTDSQVCTEVQRRVASNANQLQDLFQDINPGGDL